MNSPESVKFWINATWYGNTNETQIAAGYPYYNNFAEETEWSADQIATFFDTTNKESFGYLIK